MVMPLDDSTNRPFSYRLIRFLWDDTNGGMTNACKNHLNMVDYTRYV